MVRTIPPRERARTEAQAAIDAAGRELARGAIDERAWGRCVARALSAAYLIDDDPHRQRTWEGSRVRAGRGATPRSAAADRAPT